MSEIEVKENNGITANTLKWIAVITMFIDHIGAAIFERGIVQANGDWLQFDMMLRMIGRVAFPIYCFLLIEGFVYTRSLIKYGLNLFLFCILSEYPFDLAFRGGFTWGYQNVFFTLLFGLLTISGVSYFEKKTWKYKQIAYFLVGAVGAVVAQLCHTDYGAMGVLLIFILYITRNNKGKQCIAGGICFIYEITSILAFVLIYFYNGVRKKGINKYFFYLFYPLHLLFLYGIHLWVS